MLPNVDCERPLFFSKTVEKNAKQVRVRASLLACITNTQRDKVSACELKANDLAPEEETIHENRRGKRGVASQVP